MTEKIQTLITVTGARGTGKTTLAATYLPPSQLNKVVYFDSEKSANNFRANLKRLKLPDFGMYVDLQERFSGLPDDNDLLDLIAKGQPPWVSDTQQGALIDYYKYMLGALATISPDKGYTTLVIDTAEKLEAGMAGYVEANKKQFGITNTAYGKLWTDGVYPLYQHLLQGVYGRGIETVILVFHLKNVWEGNRPVPGKVAMSGKKLLYTLSSLMLWLVNDSRNPNGEPAGLVIKERMGRIAVNNDDWDIKQMLPPRIPTCTWKEIRHYLETGYNISSPQSREVRSPDEEGMISEMYSDAQLSLMLTDAKLQEQQNALAMAEMGGIGSTSVADPSVVSEWSKNNVITIPVAPTTRSDAMKAWIGMGRKVPAFNARLEELGISDDQIGERWTEIVGG